MSCVLNVECCFCFGESSNSHRTHASHSFVSDDDTTIQEVQKYHASSYNWIYSNRPRNQAAASGFDGHIPSNDPAYDFVAILCEIRLASRCTKLVHGHSGFVSLIREGMNDIGNTNLTSYYVQTSISKQELSIHGGGKQRGENMIQFIHEQMDNSTFTLPGGENADKKSSLSFLASELPEIHDTVLSFCREWDDNNFDVDNWWVHHPEWEEGPSNITHYCMQRIEDGDRVDFLRKVYNVEWHGNCSRAKQQYMVNSGYGASFTTILKPFYSGMLASNFEEPFQMTRHWDGAVWLFSTKDNSSWAYCETHDMNCYLLPLSKCKPVYNGDASGNGVPNYRQDSFARVTPDNTQYSWLRRYMNRYKKIVRKQVTDTLHKEYPKANLPCTAMHVRRGDAGLPRPPFRRYAAVSEYIEAGNIQPGDSIVLLT